MATKKILVSQKGMGGGHEIVRIRGGEKRGRRRRMETKKEKKQ
jgi:hypothetical protein